MIKRIPICLLLTVWLITALPAEAQQPKKVPRIGYVAAAFGSSSTMLACTEAFREVLAPADRVIR